MQTSVIVPFYQAERTIRSCIEGLLAQDLGADLCEILLVDNNSTDRSAQIASEYPGVTLLREPVQGAYAARNRGLAAARGELIAFTDPDCAPRRDWLRRITEPFASPEVQIAVGRSTPGARSLVLATLDDYERSKDTLVLGGDDGLVYYGRNNNMAVRRSLFEELGPFEERRRGADVILVRRCVDRHSCRAVRYLPEAQVVHLEIDGARTYFRKVFTYGRSLTRTAQVVPHRVIDRRGRWRVFRRACAEHGYSSARAGLLLLLLAIEGAAWKLGCWSAGSRRSAG